MRYHYLTLVVLGFLHSAHAQTIVKDIDSQIYELPTALFPTIQVIVQSTPPSFEKVSVNPNQSDVHTLGEAIDKVSGVHAGGFGPHASSPIIRGLSGNRVNISEDGTAINGLNSISPTTSGLFDAVFSQNINVNKSNDVIRSGGHGIGGSISIDSGLVSRQLEAKSANLTVVAKGGNNAPSSQGIKANFNNQDNVSVNLLYSRQHLDKYDIAGDSKADVCQKNIVNQTDRGLGINATLADSCQVHVEKEVVFNPKSKKYLYPSYIDPKTLQFTQKYYDYELSPGDVYTNQERSTAVANPQYIEGQPEYAESISKINDVTENYYKTLGNSHFENQRFGISTSYFFDSGHISASIDKKTSDYGLPGFSLSNLSYNQDYKANLPVTIDSKQNKYIFEGEINSDNNWFNQVEFNVAHVNEENKELLGKNVANHYSFNTSNTNIVSHHQPSEHLTGILGLDLSRRNIKGEGKQRYLPDVLTNKYAVFLNESLNFEPLNLSAGYRYEKVAHDIQNQNFTLNRNSPNTKLKNTQFDLNSYELVGELKVNDYIGLQASYTDAERAPEVNELYASGGHYSLMTHEEGNQKAKLEQVKTSEISALFNYQGFNLTTTLYQDDFQGYFHLKSAGATTLANRLPLKYWKQIDTKVTGFEVDANKSFDISQYGTLKVNGFADLIKNKPQDSEENGDYLINIPTNRYGLGLKWDHNNWQSSLNAVHYAKPKYLGKETNTEIALSGYTLLDFSIARKLKWHESDVTIFANASNLFNEEARPHNSPLRYIAPLPARSIGAGVEFIF